MSRTAKKSSRAARSDSDESALGRPRGFHDADWSEKIATAKEAKEAGARLRKDKPTTFSISHLSK